MKVMPVMGPVKVSNSC